MKKILIIALFLACVMQVTAQEPKRVLFIGNSYTDVNNLPQLVQQVSESAGMRVDYSRNTPGGCTFEQHCTNESMRLIQQGGWDVVVLQEQSQLPSFPQSQVERECLPFAAQLVDSIYAHNPDGEAMFYMTWGRQNGDQQNAVYFPVLGTYEGMDSMLYERYMFMARENDASVCPVGRVWRYIRNNNPDLNLYDRDGSHPSMEGSYAAACAFYTMIFHENPDRITFTAGLEESVAAYIRGAVRAVVYDTLGFWLRQPAPDTTQVDTTQTDTTQTDTTQVDTTQLGISRLTKSAFSVYPNPATHYVTVQVAEGVREALLSDIKGRRLRSITLHEGSNRIALDDLPQGVYLLSLKNAKQTAAIRIMKQ